MFGDYKEKQVLVKQVGEISFRQTSFSRTCLENIRFLKTSFKQTSWTQS